MTNIKQRARELLHSEGLRGRVPDEVQAFLRDVVALEPVAYDILSDGCHMRYVTPCVKNNWLEAFKRSSAVPLYTLGADHDPA